MAVWNMLLFLLLCPPFVLLSLPLLLLVFVSLFPVGHKHRRRASFPTARAQAGVAHIQDTLCTSHAVIFINLHTPLRNKLTFARVSLLLCDLLSERWQNRAANICSQISLKSICGKGVCAVHLHCIYVHLLFRMLAWFTSCLGWIHPK